MKFLLVKKTGRSDVYDLEKASDSTLEILGIFLVDDVGRDIAFYLNWVSDSLSVGASGNICDLTKDGNDVLIQLSEGVFCAGVVFKIEQENLKNLLNDWANLMSFQPAKIIIEQEDGIFKLIPLAEDGGAI